MLMVRPERIVISVDQPSTGASNAAVTATVTDLTFQGPIVRIALAAPDGAMIIANIDPDTDLPLLRPGDRVWASWPHHAACVLQSASTSSQPEDTP